MEQPRRVDQPEAGHFKMRLVPGGPFVAAKIERDGRLWRAVINGEAFPAAPDPVDALHVFAVWHSGRTITVDEYAHMLRVAEWAQRDAPDHPAAKPRERINIAGKPPII
jgi:hypothetical protein